MIELITCSTILGIRSRCARVAEQLHAAQLDASRRRKKGFKSSPDKRIKRKACTLVGDGEKSLLSG